MKLPFVPHKLPRLLFYTLLLIALTNAALFYHASHALSNKAMTVQLRQKGHSNRRELLSSFSNFFDVPPDSEPVVCSALSGYSDQDAERNFPSQVYPKCSEKQAKIFEIYDGKVMPLSSCVEATYVAGRNHGGEDSRGLKIIAPKLPFPRSSTGTYGALQVLSSDYMFVLCKTPSLVDVFVKLVFISAVFDRAHRKMMSMPKPFPFNIVVLTFDSVSRLHFRRKMPLSLRVLQQLSSSQHPHPHHVFDFSLHNVLGDSTVPNMVPMLVGRPVSQVTSDQVQSQALWRLARELGFATLFASESCQEPMLHQIGQFSQPTDHFLGSIWCFASSFFQYSDLSEHPRCVGRQSATDLLFNYGQEFINQYKGVGRLSFFHSMVAHERSGSLLQSADESLANFLLSLAARNDTVLILQGDHGMRYGEWRKTLGGIIEHQLPLLMMSFPEWMGRRLPAELLALRDNQNKLVTKLDLYETLKHLLLLSAYFDPSAPPPPDFQPTPILTPASLGINISSSAALGQSLFTRVSGERTCADALIPPQFCSCFPWKPLQDAQELKFRHLESTALVSAVVQAMNRELFLAAAPVLVPGNATSRPIHAPSVSSPCRPLSLLSVSQVLYQQLEGQGLMHSPSESNIKVQFTVKQDPSALFEAVVNRRLDLPPLHFESRRETFGTSTTLFDPSHFELHEQSFWPKLKQRGTVTYMPVIVNRITQYRGPCEQAARAKGINNPVTAFCVCQPDLKEVAFSQPASLKRFLTPS